MRLEDKFFQKEIRSGYEVSEKMKKIWAVELNLLEYFGSLCQEHNLRYFVDYGTLLGAVRHQGFIPWDDDVDVVMFRDDYERLQLIAQDTVGYPYFFQNSYTDIMIWAFSKIRDSRTTAIEFPDISPEFHQGIFIDIFPLDDVPDDGAVKPVIGQMQREIWMSVVDAGRLMELLDRGYRPAMDKDVLVALTKMQIRERMKIFEEFNASQFGKSTKVDHITDYFSGGKSLLREWYADIVYLPFENILVPAPVGYDNLLKCRYGDYMKPVQGTSLHEGIFWDPDKPYSEYISVQPLDFRI